MTALLTIDSFSLMFPLVARIKVPFKPGLLFITNAVVATTTSENAPLPRWIISEMEYFSRMFFLKSRVVLKNIHDSIFTSAAKPLSSVISKHRVTNTTAISDFSSG